MQKTTQANWNAIYSMTVGVSGLIMAEFLPAGVLTPMAHDLHITEGMAGQAVTATSIFAVCTSLMIAYLTRNFNRRIVLLTLSFLLTCSCLMVAFAPNFSFLLFGRFILGISLGGFWSMAAAIANRLVPDEQVPRALGIIFGGSAFSSVLAAPMGSFLGNMMGWRNVFLIAAAVGLVAFIWQVVALPSLKPIGKTRFTTTVDVLKRPQFALGLLAIAFIFCGRFASFTYLRPFLEKTTGLGVNGISFMLLVFGFSYFLGNSFSSKFIKKNLLKTLGYPPLVLSILTIGLVLVGKYPVPTGMMILIWGSVFGPVPVAWSTWVSRKIPDQAETAGGLYVAAIQIAATIGAMFGGIVYDAHGSTGVFVFSGLSWVIAAIIVFIFIRHTHFPRPHSSEENHQLPHA